MSMLHLKRFNFVHERLYKMQRCIQTIHKEHFIKSEKDQFLKAKSIFHKFKVALIFCCSILIIGCGGVHNKSSSKILPNTNVVQTTVNPSKNIVVKVNSSRHVSIIFNTNTGTATQLNSNLSALPNGWESTSGNSFSCTTINVIGNGCQLDLVFKPTNISQNGNLIINYSYLGNENLPASGIIDITYASSLFDQITATVTPTPPIVVGVYGNQLITATFNTDNLALTNFNINLSSLPAGWTSNSGNNYSCVTVLNKGNGCQVLFTYSPTTIASGTLNLPFTYTNDVGEKSSGSLKIVYNSIQPNTVNYLGPSKITAYQFGQSTATFVFNADYAIATDFSLDLSNISTQYSGWSSGSGNKYTCSTVSTNGNSCEVILNFNPQSLEDKGVLTLPYTYNSNLNQQQSGSISLEYSTTADNTVIPVPTNLNITNTINSIESTIIYFSVDYGSISGINVSNNSLPTGWSIASNTCSGTITANNPCYVVLDFNSVGYSPFQNGAFQLEYSFKNNANIQESGNIPIKFFVSPNSIINYSPIIVHPLLANVGSSKSITFTFIANNGNVTNFNYQLTSAPSDLSIQNSTSTCANGMNLNSGASCTLTVIFTPLHVTDNGFGNLSFTYLNNVGGSQGNSIHIPFATASSLVYGVSPSGTVSTLSGQAVTVTINFSTLNGPVSAINLNNTLPAGWTPSTTNCGTSLNANESCQYSLIYNPPSSLTSGTLNFDYSYLNNANSNITRTAPISYATPQWTLTNQSFGINSLITAMTISPSNVVYVGNVDSQVFSYSIDSGWSVFNNNVKDSLVITCLAASSTDVYAGTEAFFGGYMMQLPSSVLYHYSVHNPSACAVNKNGTIFYGDTNGNLYSGTSELTSDTEDIPASPFGFDSSNNLYYVLSAPGIGGGWVYSCTNNGSCTLIETRGISPLSFAADNNNNVYVGWNSTFITVYNGGKLVNTINTPSGTFTAFSLSWDSVHNNLLAALNDGSTNAVIYALTSNGWINTSFPFSFPVSTFNQFLVSDTNGNTYYSTTNTTSSNGVIYKLQY